MTTEEIMIQIDEAARHLDGSALKLYVRLLGIGVAMRTCAIEISDRWLSTELDMGHEALTEAKRQIRRFVGVDAPKGLPTRYRLPLPWLTPQQPMLFSTGAPISGALVLRNQAHTAPNSGTAVYPSQVHSAPVSGAQCADSGYTVSGYRVHGAPISGTPPTGNKDFSAESVPDSGAPLIRSDQDLRGLSNPVINQISQVALVEKLREEDKEVATLLSLDLQWYMKAHHGTSGHESTPPERILARCLAVADLDTLRKTLQTLHSEGRQAGRKFAWFVAVFLERIHGIDRELTADTFKRVLAEKNGQRPEGPLLRDEIREKMLARARRIA